MSRKNVYFLKFLRKAFPSIEEPLVNLLNGTLKSSPFCWNYLISVKNLAKHGKRFLIVKRFHLMKIFQRGIFSCPRKKNCGCSYLS